MSRRASPSVKRTYLRDAAALEVIRLREEAEVYAAYQEEIATRGVLDFGEQILRVIRLFRERRTILACYQARIQHVVVDEFGSADRFASYTVTAPIEVSSGEVTRHRLSRSGNRSLNNALHLAARVQTMHPGPGRDHNDRKLVEHTTSMAGVYGGSSFSRGVMEPTRCVSRAGLDQMCTRPMSAHEPSIRPRFPLEDIPLQS